jgi:hypothetical protein
MARLVRRWVAVDGVPRTPNRLGCRVDGHGRFVPRRSDRLLNRNVRGDRGEFGSLTAEDHQGFAKGSPALGRRRCPTTWRIPPTRRLDWARIRSPWNLAATIDLGSLILRIRPRFSDRQSRFGQEERPDPTEVVTGPFFWEGA